MGMNLNFDSIPKREPLPEGVYNLTLEKAEVKDSKNGKPMIAAQFKEPETSTVLFETFVLTPDALWKLKSFCDALGLQLSGDFDTDDLIAQVTGTAVQAKLILDDYNGSTVNRIKSYIMG